MKVNVAGAGAGKTTMMADLITSVEIPEGKIVFCIAFTNKAAENITGKVEKKLGRVPEDIRISTIHSFLNQELINPYYYILYGKQFVKLSVIDLPQENKYKGARIAQLEKEGFLHITKIPEKAKFVVYHKSNDRKAIKELRNKILERFSRYCAAIYVDEAQDIDDNVRLILEAFDNQGIPVFLYGDPKQDVKGLGQFRMIIDHTADTEYIENCHRCPQKHLNLSNTLAPKSEQQKADGNNAEGCIEIVFESDIKDTNAYIESSGFGLKFISKKCNRFNTHDEKKNVKHFETLYHEVYRAMTAKWNGRKTEYEIKSEAFYVTEKMLEAFDGSNEQSIISAWIKKGFFERQEKTNYLQMIHAFPNIEGGSTNIPVVSSIESIKGLEAEKCLFILSNDLAPYLFREKTDDNRTSHLLYVALTRSLNRLTILVMREVEEKYKRSEIIEYLNPFK